MNLTILSSVSINPTIIRTLNLLDPFFEGYPVNVTSGIRTAQHQLEIIIEKVKHHGIDKLFDEFNLMLGTSPEVKVNVDKKGDFYWWQRAWSKCLNIHDIVNPPLLAEVLLDYWRPPHESRPCGDPGCDRKHNKKGQKIDISNHQRGASFDLGGAGHDLTAIEKRVYEAEKSGKCFIRGHLYEEVNDAIHVDCIPI